VPTTLPKRRIASRDQPISTHVRIGAASVLLMAALVTVSILDRAGLSFAPDGNELVQLSASSDWTLPIGFSP
jgi:hypothetical protein